MMRLMAKMALGVSFLVAIDATASEIDRAPISERHTDISRELAAEGPRSEFEQTIVGGWPLYRTERGQEAFNHAMATLRATDRKAPPLSAFRGCEKLTCHLDLPKLTVDGWIPAGRLWVSPDQYVLIVHSPRRSKYDPGRRRSRLSMRYFVFHEFQNSSRNTDLYDTISAHSRSVFVPFYLGKTGQDAQGRRYVVVVQIAPHDIESRHAAVFSSAGPGIEVAKNRGEPLEGLQAQAGILVATIVRGAEPRLRMVHHRNVEGLPMLRAYQNRLSSLRQGGALRRKPLRLPFTPVTDSVIASAKGSLSQLIAEVGTGRDGTRPDRSHNQHVAITDQTARVSVIPQLVTPPRLVRTMRQPILTMDRLLARVLANPTPPKPRLVR